MRHQVEREREKAEVGHGWRNTNLLFILSNECQPLAVALTSFHASGPSRNVARQLHGSILLPKSVHVTFKKIR